MPPACEPRRSLSLEAYRISIVPDDHPGRTGQGQEDRYVILSSKLLEICVNCGARAQEGMDVSRSALVVSRLPRAAYECAPAPPDRSLAAGAPALPNVLAFTPCGTALPPISWSKKPISASSSSASQQRHTARQHAIEGRIYYRSSSVRRERAHCQHTLPGAELVVIPQPDGR